MRLKSGSERNNCCGRRPKEARRAVPRLSVPRYKLSLGTDDMGVPSFQPTGETLPTARCIPPCACVGCKATTHHALCSGLAWIKQALPGASRASRCHAGNKSTGLENGRNWWFWWRVWPAPDFQGFQTLSMFWFSVDDGTLSPLAVSTLLRSGCNIWPVGLQHWPTAFWMSFVSQESVWTLLRTAGVPAIICRDAFIGAGCRARKPNNLFCGWQN